MLSKKKKEKPPCEWEKLEKRQMRERGKRVRDWIERGGRQREKEREDNIILFIHTIYSKF